MARTNGTATPAGPIELADARIKTWTPRPAKFDKDGNETEAPSVALTFVVPLDLIGPYMTRLAWLFRHDVVSRLTVDAPEQRTFSDIVHDHVRSMAPTPDGGASITTDDGRTTHIPRPA